MVYIDGPTSNITLSVAQSYIRSNGFFVSMQFYSKCAIVKSHLSSWKCPYFASTKAWFSAPNAAQSGRVLHIIFWLGVLKFAFEGEGGNALMMPRSTKFSGDGLWDTNCQRGEHPQ